MLTLKFREKSNWRTMIRVEKQIERGVGEGVKATAEAIVADIRSSWSSVAPSNRGNPPAIRSGVLDASVKVENQGRDDEGRFGTKEGMAGLVWYIQVNTEENDPDGDNYAMALEDPDYLDRPFLSPAMKRAEGYYTSNIKRFVRL